MIRLYVKVPLCNHQEISLGGTQSHYIQKVMRLKEGNTLLLFNNTQGEWQAKIKALEKKSTILSLLSQTRVQQKEADIWILFSPLKPKRQEFLVEKATELGVSCLWPVCFERTSISKLNFEKMEAHVIEATEQSDRLRVPSINPLIRLPELLKKWPKERILIFGDETFQSPSLGVLELNPRKPYAFLVGPEGGFTSRELDLLRSHPKAQGVTLNPHILRTETAALAGLSYLQIHMRL